MQRFKQLDKRLSAIAGFVREGATICDVGTDHAYLPCFLARSGRYGQVYACDLNEKPLEFARSTVEKQGADVVLLQSDGLLNVPPCDDVIIAGMGGELIAEIIEKIPAGFKTRDLRLILQPMTKQDDLQQALDRLGFEIVHKSAVYERNRKFTIIYARLKNDST
jgi:tRNA (adenine22-N1)-methyltransferase